MSLIDIKNVSYSIGEKLILHLVNASFQKNKFTVILGRNGSGKSSLFRILSGIEKKFGGNIDFNSKNPPKIGFLTQFHQMVFPFTVFDVVLTGRSSFFKISPKKEDKDAVTKILESFQLNHLSNTPYTSLSGGERQLVLLCRVLVQNPDILLLDEPTNHLDLHYQIKVLQLMRDWVNQKNCTIVCIMHDPNLALQFADHIYVMQNKRLNYLAHTDAEYTANMLSQAYEVSLSYVEHYNKTFLIPEI